MGLLHNDRSRFCLHKIIPCFRRTGMRLQFGRREHQLQLRHVATLGAVHGALLATSAVKSYVDPPTTNRTRATLMMSHDQVYMALHT